jgi:hypothetical protein
MSGLMAKKDSRNPILAAAEILSASLVFIYWFFPKSSSEKVIQGHSASIQLIPLVH